MADKKEKTKEKVRFPCSVSKKCSGCQLTNLSYGDQLKMKQAKVARLLSPFARIKPISGMDNPFHYRNKACAVFDKTSGGKLFAGIYQSKDGRVVKSDSCLIESEIASGIIRDSEKILRDLKVAPYDRETGKGSLRHILVRVTGSGRALVALTGTAPHFKESIAYTERILKLHPEIETIVYGHRRDKVALQNPDNEEILYGNGYVTDTLCKKEFRISQSSFYQINRVQTEKLYSYAVKLAEMTGEENVIDAYCGIGTIGLIASDSAKKVVGVETNASAVACAKENAKINEVTNAEFVCDDAGKFMRKMVKAKEKADVVFMDPPRQGASPEFLASLVMLSPNKIVYISCNPETLARDLRFLTRKKYAVNRIKPFDMFPYTGHVECAVLLTKEK